MHSHAALLKQLKSLGLAPGQLVMLHASLRKVGPVEGDADVLLDAILRVLGNDGTLLMVLGADPTEPFVASSTPAELEMGILAETFRTRPGVLVNDHAAARFAAVGPLATELIDDPPLHDYHGPGSVLQRFTNHHGQVLRLGADVDTVTLTHWAEYLADVPDKRRAKRHYVREDIGEQWIEGLDDDDGIKEWSEGDYFSQILIDFIADCRASTGKIGDCTAELFGAQTFVDFAVDWMERHLA